MISGVKLSQWARANGVGRQSASGWFLAGVLSVPARQSAAGVVLADVPDRAAAGVAIYAPVSSSGQRRDLGRQVSRLAEYLTADGLAPAEIICGVGLGLNGHRTRLLGLLWGALVGTVVAGQAEVSDELVRDVGEVLAGFCAGRCGRRSAKHRAELALAARCAEAA
jgi:putative resolvase